MALEAAFCELTERLGTLRDELLDLRTTVLEDKPLEGGVVLIDVLGDTIDDLLGWIEEALAEAGSGRLAVGDELNVHRARRSLVACQERYVRIMRRFTFELAGHEQLAELLRFGQLRGHEWRAWTESTSDALLASHRTVFDGHEALCRCWQELAEGISITRAHALAAGAERQLTTAGDRSA